MRSPARSTGELQPKIASLAVQGVRRSIWARIMPSRKSTARLGNSRGRNRTLSDFINTSRRLPRNAASHSAGSAGSGRPCDRRKTTSGNAASFCPEVCRAVRALSSPSIIWICRGRTTRSVAASTAPATAVIHSPNRTLISAIIVIRISPASATGGSSHCPATTARGRDRRHRLA